MISQNVAADNVSVNKATPGIDIFYKCGKKIGLIH